MKVKGLSTPCESGSESEKDQFTSKTGRRINDKYQRKISFPFGVNGPLKFHCKSSCFPLPFPKFLPPATKLRQGNVFTPGCHSVHRGGVCHTHPSGTRDKHPLGRHPPGQTPPLGRHTLCVVHAGIRFTSGRYASYWNAFLFTLLKLFSKISPESTRDSSKFESSVLGTFTADIFVGPNTIDFNYVFSNFGAALADSPLVLIVIVVLYILFIITAIVAHWEDRKDVQMVKANIFFHKQKYGRFVRLPKKFKLH